MRLVQHVRLLVAVIGITILSAILLFYPASTRPNLVNPPPEQVLLSYSSEWNDLQSINSCGPYSAAAMIRIITGSDIDSETISQETPLRIRGYTLPFTLPRVLARHGVNVREQRIVGSKDEQVDWIRTQIAEQRPVILLGRAQGVLHYVTVVGYTDNQFHIYDSLAPASDTPGRTIDTNNDLPGNVDWDADTIFTFWSGGWHGLYTFYAITPNIAAPK